jgi:hypothetical protein
MVSASRALTNVPLRSCGVLDGSTREVFDAPRGSRSYRVEEQPVASSSISPGASEARPTRLHSTSLLLTVVLVLIGLSSTPAQVHADTTSLTVMRQHHYHDGTLGSAARKSYDATSTYILSHRIRTRIVRSTDSWSNTISSRYRKFVHCTARQLSKHVWCTTRLVDGFSSMCITPQPKAGGASPCRGRRLDVRGVYHPRTGVLRITCVNRR